MSQSAPRTLNTPLPSEVASLVGVARALVQSSVIDVAKAQALQNAAAAEKRTFMETLALDSRSSSRRAAEALAAMFDAPFVDLDSVRPDVFPPDDIFDRKKIEELRAIPLYVRGSRLFVATSDPTNTDAIDFFSHKSGRKCETLIADETQVAAFIVQMNGQQTDISLSNEELDFDLSGDSAPAEDETPVDVALANDETPVVKLVKSILLIAIKRGASDIHFEPYEKYYRIRLRIDGVLQEVARPSAQYAPFITSRIKVISGLNIAEKRVPQDGRMKMKMEGGRDIDFRVSTCPVMYGEKIVMRILDPSAAKVGIDSLGYDPDQKEQLLGAIKRPYGMVLVTGPTGSGKTVSLYTCLNILNKDDINISTAEDPVEIQLPGINQVNVNSAQGLTFAGALKSFLRQDPDIIMVGEIRDEETASISVKAAQTGHMVLATLHTNDAPKTVGRLLEIGVPAYQIAGAVTLITAQRLARRLCTRCRVHDREISAATLSSLGMPESDIAGMNTEWTPYRNNPEGCEHCNMGYSKRVGVYQVMPITEGIRRIILAGGNAMQIAEQAKREGIRDLRQSGLLKFRQGLTSLQQVLDITNED